MRIHKLIIIGLVATSLLASCKKEEKPNAHSNLNLDGVSFKANTESGARNAKTYLDGQDVKWMEGDLILVQNSANQQAPFEVVEGIQTMNGTFYTGSDFDLAPAYDAAYPSSKVTLSGTTATFTLPQQQQMTVTGTFGNGAMPMVAHSTNNVLNFYNVCGGVCFPLQGAGKHVSKIVLTSKNSSDKLWGTFTASTTAVPQSGNVTSGPMPTHQSGGSNSVELVCNGNTGIDLTAEPQDFYIMVPPQTMTSGFTVTVYDGTNVIYNQDINWDAATHANFIKRSVVSRVHTPITIADPLTVTTISPTTITINSAKGIGDVRGGVASECGIIYAKASYIGSNTPADVLDYDQVDGTNVMKLTSTCNTSLGEGVANFDANMTGLTSNTIYYVRAYAINSVGTTYGDCIPFATRRDYYANETNQGVLRRRTADGDSNNNPFEFSVSGSQKVYFSVGNLQWRSSGTHSVATGGSAAGTWRFADYQYSYEGDTQANSHPTASGNAWMDLFAWGTSGWDNGDQCYQPYSSLGTGDYGDPYLTYYYVGGTTYWQISLVPPLFANADWGVYNAISNGGNTPNSWRVDTSNEWGYLINSRRNYRYTLVSLKVGGAAGNHYSVVNGTESCIINSEHNEIRSLIIFPDGFTWPTNLMAAVPYNNQSSPTNGLTEAQWSLLEHYGCVLLPGAGARRGGQGFYEIARTIGTYWSSTYYNEWGGTAVQFGSGVSTGYNSGRQFGISVRLVRPQ